MADSPLFGLVPAGQPLLTQPTSTPSPTSYIYTIPAPPSSSQQQQSQPPQGSTSSSTTPPQPKTSTHITIFLLPGITLPTGSAAAIYLVTAPPPGSETPQSRFLGGIGPGKESAIFKVSLPSSGPSPSSTSSPSSAPGTTTTIIGISLEEAGSVAQRIEELKASASAVAAASTSTSLVRGGGGGGQPSTLVLAQRIIQNAFNFLAGFSGQAGQVEVVPLKAFEDWWKKFEGRVRSDPGFLERGEQ